MTHFYLVCAHHFLTCTSFPRHEVCGEFSEATCQALHCIVLFLRAFIILPWLIFYLVPGFTKACTSFPRHEACGEFWGNLSGIALHCFVFTGFYNFTMTHFYLVPSFTKACTSFPRHEACGEFLRQLVRHFELHCFVLRAFIIYHDSFLFSLCTSIS